MTPFRSVLDLCRPPSGYAFAGGVWVTHDLDVDGLAAHILPALCGSDSADVRRRTLAGRDLPAPLTVLADQSRIHGRAAAVQLKVLVATGPRRFHPKAAVLTFRRGQSMVARAAVMSANLTASGVTNSWEAMAASEGVGTGSLASAVVSALDELTVAEVGPAAAGWRRAVRALGLQGAPDSRLLASWGPQSSLPDRLGQRTDARTATHLDIVDAGFAVGPERDLVAALRAAFPAVEHFSLTVPEHPRGGTAALSPALLAGLRDAFGPVELSFVPLGRDTRRLHAKVLRWKGPDGAAALVGSANLTSRGLMGRNLELGVVVAGDGLVTLPSRACNDAGGPWPSPDDEDSGPAWPAVEARARFVRRDRLARSLHVLLTVEASGGWPLRRRDWEFHSLTRRIDGQGWRQPGANGRLCNEVPAEIDEDNWVVELRDVTRDRSRNIPVDVTDLPSAGPDEDLDIEDPPPGLLTSLVKRLEPLLSVPGEATDIEPGGPRSGVQATDRLIDKDSSMVHNLAKIALWARSGQHADATWAADELHTGLRDETVIAAHGLTGGERWAINLLLDDDTAGGDELGSRVRRVLGRLV